MACFSSVVPAAGVYFVNPASMAAFGGRLDVGRRVEIRLAGAELDDVDPALPHLVGFDQVL